LKQEVWGYIKLGRGKKERNIYLRPGQNISCDRKMQKRAGWLARKNQMLPSLFPRWLSADAALHLPSLQTTSGRPICQLFCPSSFIWHAFHSSFRLVSSTMHFHVIVIDSRFYFYGHLEVRWECKVIICQISGDKKLCKCISCWVVALG
jgi:hypothetical protein